MKPTNHLPDNLKYFSRLTKAPYYCICVLGSKNSQILDNLCEIRETHSFFGPKSIPSISIKKVFNTIIKFGGNQSHICK